LTVKGDGEIDFADVGGLGFDAHQLDLFPLDGQREKLGQFGANLFRGVRHADAAGLAPAAAKDL
jgi:hypothetical protein